MSSIPGSFSQREDPEHTGGFSIENMSAFRDVPEARVLPAPDGELIEKRHGMARFDGGEQRTIAGRQSLISATAFARVINFIARRIRLIRVAWIDAPEVRQQ